ncbi:Annexin [Dirofilaria immitis]
MIEKKSKNFKLNYIKVPLEDLKESARELTEALMLRKEYMERIGNQFPLTTKNFLSGHYPKNLPKCRRKNIEITIVMTFTDTEKLNISLSFFL